MRIKDISSENRPRERLKEKGAASLSDAELLAVIFQKGTRELNALDMSNQLLSKHDLKKLGKLSLKELQEIRGIGFAKACQITALYELNKRINSVKTDRYMINSDKDVYEYLNPKMSGLDKEHFAVLLLDSKNKVIKHETVSVGILNSTLIHPREIFKTAIKESANAIILAHNHTSGDPEPSQEDLGITEKIVQAGETLNIKVLDHVIIGKDKWWSWAEHN